MAVVSVKEQHQRRRSTLRDGKLIHLRTWLVVTSDIRDGTAAALVADDGTNRVPFYREPYPGRPTCLVSSIEANPVQNSGRHFEVQVEYTDGDIEAFPLHPLERAADISWGASEGTEPYFIDQSDPPKPVANSAGDSFDQFMERENGQMVITYAVNVPDHDANDAETYSHTVNQDIVVLDGTVFGPGTLKLSPIQAQKMSEVWMGETVEFYKRTYTLKARRDGWKDKPLDIGLNEIVQELDSDTNTLVNRIKPILDRSGSQLRKPHPLNGAGKRKPSATDKPAVLEFAPYKTKSWAPLSFE